MASPCDSGVRAPLLLGLRVLGRQSLIGCHVRKQPAVSIRMRHGPVMSLPLTFVLDRIETPTGFMHLVTDAHERVCAFDWEAPRLRERLSRRLGADLHLSVGRSPAAVVNALEAYFSGDLRALDRLQTWAPGTPFQEAVWQALRAIPVGETASYGAIAARIGKPKATRAVGLANNQNPIGIIVPCHRVIGASGALTGYAGGIERKRWLLQHEGVQA